MYPTKSPSKPIKNRKNAPASFAFSIASIVAVPSGPKLPTMVASGMTKAQNDKSISNPPICLLSTKYEIREREREREREDRRVQKWIEDESQSVSMSQNDTNIESDQRTRNYKQSQRTRNKPQRTGLETKVIFCDKHCWFFLLRFWILQSSWYDVCITVFFLTNFDIMKIYDCFSSFWWSLLSSKDFFCICVLSYRIVQFVLVVSACLWKNMIHDCLSLHFIVWQDHNNCSFQKRSLVVF